MTALDYFRMFATEFAGIADADVNKWLALATNDVYAPCLSAEELARAQALYAAHLLKQSEDAANGGARGTITSEKEGDLQRSYGTGAGSYVQKGSTPYYDQYFELVSRCFGATILTRF